MIGYERQETAPRRVFTNADDRTGRQLGRPTFYYRAKVPEDINRRHSAQPKRNYAGSLAVEEREQPAEIQIMGEEDSMFGHRFFQDVIVPQPVEVLLE